MAKIRLDIVTAEKVVFSDDVDSVIVPGIDGELGVLPTHAPLMTIIAPGELIVRQGETEVDMAVSGGFIEVRPDRVIVLADSAERAEDIDIARAEEARKRAEEAKSNSLDRSPDEAFIADAALKRALARIKVARRRRERPM